MLSFSPYLLVASLKDFTPCAGADYMTERAKLAKQYQGESLELQIQNLQNRLFGAEEAVFIRNEEKAGNFRYKERQIIGVN